MLGSENISCSLSPGRADYRLDLWSSEATIPLLWPGLWCHVESEAEEDRVEEDEEEEGRVEDNSRERTTVFGDNKWENS